MTLIDRLSKLDGPDNPDAITEAFQRCARSFTNAELLELMKFAPVIAYGIALLRAKEASHGE